MTLLELISIVDKAYGPDGLVLLYHTHPDEPHGDTLAQFLALELEDTYDVDASRTE
jgi:hypothetical protein